MDWGKAKNIFIISFLMLNIILGFQLYIKYNTYNKIWTTDSNEELRRVLTKNSTILEIDLPKEESELNIMKINNVLNFSDTIIIRPGEQGISKDKLELMLEGKINKFNEYEYSLAESDNRTQFVYYQAINGYLFFDAKLFIEVDQKGNVEYQQKYFEIINIGIGKQVIPSNSALKTAIEQQFVPKGSEIIDMELGYKIFENDSGIQDIIPVWGITYRINNAVRTIYINSITGLGERND